MITYEDALQAMELLLDSVGEHHWRDWVRQDLTEWRCAKQVGHHLSAYGGMGSFNDLYLCRTNRHDVTEAQEPWVNCLFEDLRSICYHLARHTGRRVSSAGLARTMGRVGVELSGWRCLACGYAEVTQRDTEWYIARHLVRRGILDTCASGDLAAFFRSVLTVNLPELDAERAALSKSVLSSGLRLTAREGWLRPCPNCGGQNTAVFRWVRASRGELFVPASNNLPPGRPTLPDSG
jgi:hypothetical protein